jgi:SIR2-like protein
MRVLLLGAGFSRNWGAPLSEEINGSLLSDLHDDEALAKKLKDRPFEELFSGFSTPSGSDDEARRQIRFQNAVTATFKRLNDTFHPSDLEFMRANLEIRFSVANFLSRFDLIFTLNQDLLLEKMYMLPGRPRVPVRPGLERVGSSSVWRPNGQHTMQLGTSVQPYVKLHGSTDWEGEGGEALLIMGNAKSGAIERFSLLHWYHQEFKNCLSRGGVKLMVIGYSFQDEHINRVICTASKDCTLGTFIVDPRGRSVLADPKMRGALIPGPPRDVEGIRIVGELRRSLREIFSGDRFATGEIDKFLSG